MNDVARGNLLLVAQTVCELGMLLPGRRLWHAGPALAAGAAGAMAGGAALGVSGALTLGRHVRLHPLPPPGAVLQTRGPYRCVRHPIYVGILAAAAGLAILRGRAAPVVAFAAMIAVLSSKATDEERALLSRFGSDYRRYCATVMRGLPPTPWLGLPE